jgi:hypothetical protein
MRRRLRRISVVSVPLTDCPEWTSILSCDPHELRPRWTTLGQTQQRK